MTPGEKHSVTPRVQFYSAIVEYRTLRASSNGTGTFTVRAQFATSATLDLHFAGCNA